MNSEASATNNLRTKHTNYLKKAVNPDRRIPAALENVTEENDEYLRKSIKFPEIGPSTRTHIEDNIKAVGF